MFKNLRADIKKNLDYKKKKGILSVLKLYLEEPSLWAITDYRFKRWSYQHIFKIPLFGFLLYIIYKIIFSNVIYAFSGVKIHHNADIGKGLMIFYGNGLVVGPASIGKNCSLYHQVTIGKKNFGEKMLPKIGNNVVIFSGSKILGEITIGDNVTIGANSVVDKSFPNNVIVGGIPGKVLRKVVKNSEKTK